jgi:muconate cycloisomerase
VRIDAVTLHRVRIPLKSGFRHALRDRKAAAAVVVAVRAEDGTVGHGEIVPRAYLTGETLETVLAREAPALARAWLGTSFHDADEVVDWLRRRLEQADRALATLAGFELATLDLAGRYWGRAIHEILGWSPGPQLPPGVVIGFDVATDALPRHCALLRLMGKRHVKVKVGLDDDEARLEAVFGALDGHARIRIDANGAWRAAQAVAKLSAWRRFDIRSVEQPVPAHDLAGMRQVREMTGVPVMADESLCSLTDARRLIGARAADVFNVRVGKCGGLLGCARIVELARSHGIARHLGALVAETGILSKAGEILGRCHDGFECLEGKSQNRFLLDQDVVEPAAAAHGGAERGLGLEVRMDRVADYAVSAPVVFERSSTARPCAERTQ